MANKARFEDTYITIQGWMVSKLGLSGSKLMAFALVYGFCQDGQSEFTGSLKYICKWVGCSKPTAIKAMSELCEGDLLNKNTQSINNVTFNRYSVNFSTVQDLRGSKETLPGVVKKLNHGSKETLPNNTSNTIIDNSLVGQDPTSPIPFSEIINYLNEKIGTNYKTSTKATKAKISARWKEGFRLEDFQRVIDCKAAAWQYDTKMKQYLRPETLFGTKFESYLNACNSQPDVNLVHDLIDIELQESQTHDYLNYHQTIKDKFPRLYANVRMLKASDYFDLKPGAKRYELLNYRFTVSEIKKSIAKAHQDIEKGLMQGRSYVDVLTELNGLLRQTV